VKWRELEGREPIINTVPLLSRHPKRIWEKEWFCLEECGKRVMLPGSEDSHKLCGAMKPCMGIFSAWLGGFFLAAMWLFLAAGLQAFSWWLLTQAGLGRP